MPTELGTDEVLAMLQEVAAQVITPRFQRLSEDDISSKSHPGDLVTVADREAEVLITERLLAAYPRALVLGEEAASADPGVLDRFRDADHAFTVDPVDGTRNFVKGSPDHAVMAAELRGGEVVRSWIWQPQHRAAYVAERGAGAWRNDVRVHRPPVGDGLLGITSRRGWIGRALGTLRTLELSWRCCGVDYPAIVDGRADYALYKKTKPWDHAPGSLLVAEAGGHVGTFRGEPYRPQGPAPTGLVVAADRATYDVVRGLVPTLPGR
ncbi:inositol monophosphatase [Nocardioides sp. Arc9.136]|uniref:inositol monophosphatase family protein n=1 Tax=Nocardioides sp. Arc9.136 TaxID=2996826 RepID=UPI002667012C|nr:inositol monophosphatase [Nocardioides sp. Arc9.136]WKN48370.1 inositol monophosphatase [Nocardioides sp. Arc9.136]